MARRTRCSFALRDASIFPAAWIKVTPVEREAFARARRFLDYSPLSKWSALTAAVGTGILYVALLVILGFFVDLVVNRGQIPAIRDLSPAQQVGLFDGWEMLD